MQKIIARCREQLISGPLAELGAKEKQTAVIAEGNSIRSIERMTGIHRDTIMRIGIRVGDGCAQVLDEKMRGLDGRRRAALEAGFKLGHYRLFSKFQRIAPAPAASASARARGFSDAEGSPR